VARVHSQLDGRIRLQLKRISKKWAIQTNNPLKKLTKVLIKDRLMEVTMEALNNQLLNTSLTCKATVIFKLPKILLKETTWSEMNITLEKARELPLRFTIHLVEKAVFLLEMNSRNL